MEQTMKTEPQQNSTTTQKSSYAGTEVQIGGGRFGMRPLAQHGTILISDGKITLLNTQKQLIAQAPITQCSASKTPWYLFSQGVWLTIRGVRYFVSITYFGSLSEPATTRLSRGEATRRFLNVIHSSSQS